MPDLVELRVPGSPAGRSIARVHTGQRDAADRHGRLRVHGCRAFAGVADGEPRLRSAGSGPDGRLFDDGDDGEIATCQDWTSNTLRGTQGNAVGAGGQVPVGHMWPRNNNSGRQWIQDHTINGCEPGFDIDGGGGAATGDFRVGAGGGYGAIYCFALGAVAPEG